MSSSLSRASLARIANMLACVPILAVTSGCYHRSSAGDEPSPAARVKVGNDQWSDNDRRVRSFPGIDIVRTRNGGFSIRILSGLATGGWPLYVIDDTPTTVDPGRGIDWFKPEDIVKIKVLKDPAETAVYGPSGVHGVVLVNTRQGARLRERAP